MLKGDTFDFFLSFFKLSFPLRRKVSFSKVLVFSRSELRSVIIAKRVMLHLFRGFYSFDDKKKRSNYLRPKKLVFLFLLKKYYLQKKLVIK